jgi:Holliday junction resolvase RusA-like endonuclease
LAHFDYTKKDLGNLLKYIRDVANGVIYHDDSAVVRIMMEKKRLEAPLEGPHGGQRLEISFSRYTE